MKIGNVAVRITYSITNLIEMTCRYERVSLSILEEFQESCRAVNCVWKSWSNCSRQTRNETESHESQRIVNSLEILKNAKGSRGNADTISKIRLDLYIYLYIYTPKNNKIKKKEMYERTQDHVQHYRNNVQECWDIHLGAAVVFVSISEPQRVGSNLESHATVRRKS